MQRNHSVAQQQSDDALRQAYAAQGVTLHCTWLCVCIHLSSRLNSRFHSRTAQLQSGAQGQLWSAHVQGIGNVALKQFSIHALASAQTEIQAVSAGFSHAPTAHASVHWLWAAGAGKNWLSSAKLSFLLGPGAAWPHLVSCVPIHVIDMLSLQYQRLKWNHPHILGTYSPIKVQCPDGQSFVLLPMQLATGESSDLFDYMKRAGPLGCNSRRLRELMLQVAHGKCHELSHAVSGCDEPRLL